MNELVAAGKIYSSEEVYEELMQGGAPDLSREWARDNKVIFLPVTDEIGQHVVQIFRVEHFRQNI